MREKYAEDYERRIVILSENKIETGNYKIFDYYARVITRKKLKRVVEDGHSLDESCLIITNRDGETIAITREFEMMLRNALQIKK